MALVISHVLHTETRTFYPHERNLHKKYLGKIRKFFINKSIVNDSAHNETKWQVWLQDKAE